MNQTCAHFFRPTKLGAPFVTQTNEQALMIQIVWGLNQQYGHVFVYHNNCTAPETTTHGHLSHTNYTDNALFYIRFTVTETNEIEIDNMQSQPHVIKKWLPVEGKNRQKAALRMVMPYMVSYLCDFAFVSGIDCVLIPTVDLLKYTSCGEGLHRYVENKKEDEENNEPVVLRSYMEEAITWYDIMPEKLGFTRMEMYNAYGKEGAVWRFCPSKRGCKDMQKAAVKNKEALAASIVCESILSSLSSTPQERTSGAYIPQWEQTIAEHGFCSLPALRRLQTINRWVGHRSAHYLFAVLYTAHLYTDNKYLSSYSWYIHDLLVGKFDTNEWNTVVYLFETLPDSVKAEVIVAMSLYDDRVREERNKECGFDFDVFVVGIEPSTNTVVAPTKVPAGKK